jgi:hypothetical protein
MSLSELDDYRSQFAAIAEQAGELAAGLDEERFNWRPAPEKWSIEECLGHLVVVGQQRVRVLEEGIRRGRERRLTGEGPFTYGPVERWFVRLTEPPPRLRVSAPRRFRPQHGQPVTAVLPTFLHLQSQLMAQADAARGLDLRRIKVASPVSRWLRMSLGMALAQAAAHERRHLEQARRVLDELNRAGAAPSAG